MMQRLRLLVLGIVGFLGVFFAHGSWLNRLLAFALCGVLSADSGLCMAQIAKFSGQANATTPILLSQRSSEFDDPPDITPSNNPQAPPFPLDAGPNIIRPDFANPDQNPPNTSPTNTRNTSPSTNNSSLAGIWFYSIYSSPSPNDLIATIPLQILEGSSSLQSLIAILEEPEGEASNENIIVEWLGDRSKGIVWSGIIDTQTRDEMYVYMSKSELTPQQLQNLIGTDMEYRQDTASLFLKFMDKYISLDNENLNNVDYANSGSIIRVPRQSPRPRLGDFRTSNPTPPRVPTVKTPTPPGLSNLGRTLSRGVGRIAAGAQAAASIGKGAAIADWCSHNYERCKICIRNTECRNLMNPEFNAWEDIGLILANALENSASATQPPQPPVITSLTCNGSSDTCQVSGGQYFEIELTYEDENGDASQWSMGRWNGSIASSDGRRGTITRRDGPACCASGSCNIGREATINASVSDGSGQVSQQRSVRVVGLANNVPCP